MNGSEDDRMDALEELVGMAFEAVDPVPDDVVDKAGDALRWRSAGDVAFIVADAELVAVRGGVDVEPSQTFRSASHTIEVTVEGTALVGSIDPWSGGHARVETAAWSAPVAVDERGWFHVDVPEGKWARLHFEESTGTSVTTSWIRLSRDRSS